MAIQNNLTDSTTRCSDITDGNTPNTSVENRKPKQTKGSQIEQKPLEQSETPKDEKSQKSVEPYREFLITDLKLWTFSVQGHEYTARNCPVERWIYFFSEWSKLDPATDWTDLEERADFLTQLWSHCYQYSLSFPLTENINAG